MGKRIESIDNTKWILTLLMCLFHIQLVSVESGSATTFLAIKNLGDCVVPAFAIISGFFFWRDVNSINDLKIKAKRRIFTLLIPYLAWNILNYMFNGICNMQSPISLLFNINIYQDIIIGNASPHFWYIYMLMFWVIFSPLLLFAYKNKIALVFLFLSQIIYILFKGNNILHSRYIYMLYTWAGLIGFKHPDLFEKINNINKDLKIKISCISFVLYLLIYCFYTRNYIEQRFIVWMFAVRSLLLIFSTISLPTINIKFNYCKYSFWIFAVHYWLDVHVSRITCNITQDLIIYQFLTWSIVVCVGLISGIIANKYTPKIFYLLNGGRK